MNKTLDVKRILAFLLIAFGFSWIVGLVVFLTGGIAGSKPIVSGSAIPWALPLLVMYMLGPAIANFVTRIITKEGWKEMLLRPQIERGWPFWLIAWILTPLMVLAGAAVYFLLFSQQLNLEALAGGSIPGFPEGSSLAVIFSGIAISILIAPIANALPILGEELGWRGYLQPKLLPLGERKMYLLVGFVWGAWHWPVIWMGYNYPGYPLWGSLGMVWFCFVFGTFIGWASLRAGSIWPAVIGHGALNGIAAAPLILLNGQQNPMLGPTAVGIIGSIFFTLATTIIFWKAKSQPASAPIELEPKTV